MAAIDSSSSWGPHEYAQPPPPAAQAPKPTLVMSMPVFPKGRVGKPTVKTSCGVGGPCEVAGEPIGPYGVLALTSTPIVTQPTECPGPTALPRQYPSPGNRALNQPAPPRSSTAGG